MTGPSAALIVAVWYLIVDTAGGQPFHTPNTAREDLLPRRSVSGAPRVVPEVVLGYTVVAFRPASPWWVWDSRCWRTSPRRNIALRMGMWIGMVVAFGLFAGLTYMLGTATGRAALALDGRQRQPARRAGHGGVPVAPAPPTRRSFDEAPLGDEVPAPPHPPEGPGPLAHTGALPCAGRLDDPL